MTPRDWLAAGALVLLVVGFPVSIRELARRQRIGSAAIVWAAWALWTYAAVRYR